jgi:hypothetical protein
VDRERTELEKYCNLQQSFFKKKTTKSNARAKNQGLISGRKLRVVMEAIILGIQSSDVKVKQNSIEKAHERLLLNKQLTDCQVCIPLSDY